MLPNSRLIIGRSIISNRLKVTGIYTTSHNIKIGYVYPDFLIPLNINLVRKDSTST